MKKLLIILILVSNCTFAQNIPTKFVLSGYLTDQPKTLSLATCEFKKRKKVSVVDFMGGKWWKVNYNSCIGYVTTPFLFISDDLVKFREIRTIEIQDEIIRKNDSIAESLRIQNNLRKADSIAKIKKKNNLRKADSIAKIKKKDSLRKTEIIAETRKLDSIKEVKNQKLKKYLKYTHSITFNKNFIVTLKSNTKIFEKPSSSSKLLLETSWDDAYVMGYNSGYYKIYVNDLCGYIREYNIFKNDYVKNFYDDIKDKKYLKKFGKRTYDKIKKGQYWIGMTKEMARLSLGSPNADNRSVGSWGIHNQWVYRSKGINLYFENGILTSWQD